MIRDREIDLYDKIYKGVNIEYSKSKRSKRWTALAYIRDKLVHATGDSENLVLTKIKLKIDAKIHNTH